MSALIIILAFGTWGHDCVACGDALDNGPKHGGTGMALYDADTLHGDYTTGAVALWNTTSGDIVISDVPPGAVVRKAYLIWAIVSNAADSSMSLNGTPLTAVATGNSPTPCRAGFGSTTFAYIADVSSLVSGNGTYTLTGYHPSTTEGASLVIIYELASDPLRNIVVHAGSYTLTGGTYAEYRWDIADFEADNPVVSARITFMFDDGQDFPTDTCGREYIYYGTECVDSGPTTIPGSAGAYWDDLTYDVAAFTSPGQTSVQVGYGTNTDTDSGGCTDCIGVAGAVLSVNTVSPTAGHEAAQPSATLVVGPGFVRVRGSGTRGSLKAYSPDGRLVSVLASGQIAPGRYDLTNLGQGLYIVRLTGQESLSVKVTVR